MSVEVVFSLSSVSQWFSTFEFSRLSYNERTDDQTIMKLKYWNGVFKKGRSHLNNASEWMCTPPVPFYILGELCFLGINVLLIVWRDTYSTGGIVVWILGTNSLCFFL